MIYHVASAKFLISAGIALPVRPHARWVRTEYHQHRNKNCVWCYSCNHVCLTNVPFANKRNAELGAVDCGYTSTRYPETETAANASSTSGVTRLASTRKPGASAYTRNS